MSLDSHHTGKEVKSSALPRPIKLCVVATADITIQNLCRGRLEYLVEHGYDVTVVCGPTNMADQIRARGLKLFTPVLTRAISPFTDLRCLMQLRRFFCREQFHIIEISTPKAALLGAIAARLAIGSKLVHLLRGLAYQRQSFLSALLMRWSQRIPSILADSVIAVSPSLRERAIADRVVESERTVVLGSGSSNGVDTARFSPRLRERRAELRAQLRIPMDAVVAGFVGRMTADKGIAELIPAFLGARMKHPNLHLLIVGDYEHRDKPAPRIVDLIERDPHIVRTGWQSDTAAYYGAMDFLVLPSRREGFANVLLEAQSAGLPVIATDIEGCRDAVRPNETGLLVPLDSTDALQAGLEKLTGDAALRQHMGDAGRAWVIEHFDQQRVWELYDEHYKRLMGIASGSAASHASPQ